MCESILYQTCASACAAPGCGQLVIESARREAMGDTITVYQKPTCTKCRQTLARLNECGVEFEAVNYYETPLTEEALRELINKLGIAPRELLRKGEAIYRELELGKR